MPEYLFCSVVVCTRHRPARLERCLTGLGHLDYPRYELIVVDNTSGDEDVHQLADAAGALSRARNAGARAARGELVAFIDDDAVAEPSWLRARKRRPWRREGIDGPFFSRRELARAALSGPSLYWGNRRAAPDTQTGRRRRAP